LIDLILSIPYFHRVLPANGRSVGLLSKKDIPNRATRQDESPQT
jgi:hypothetical protein